MTAPRTAARFDRGLILPMILGAVLNPVNSSLIAVALVPIGMAFGASPAETAWLVSGLYLATAVGQPVVGRLVDMYGPRRLYLAGAALVGIGGVVGATASSLTMLVVARVIIGIGTCAGYPAAMHLIRSESDRTGQDSPAGVLTALAVGAQTISVIGPTLGGVLIGLGGWRMIFTVNVPLAVVCVVWGAVKLPKRHRRISTRLDAPGIVLFAGMLLALLVFLMNPAVGHWYLLVAMAGLAVGFVLRERRVADPFLDVRVLAGNVPLLLTYARTLLTYTISYAFLYGYTQWLEEGRGLSASAAGLALLPMSVTGVLVSTATGRRPEIRRKLLVGGAAQVVACGLLLLAGSTSPVWLLVVIGVVIGLPQGLNGLANQNALYHQADPARMGSSAGLLRTFAYLGAIVASAANGAYLGAGTAGLHDLAVFLIAVAAVFVAVTLVDRSLHRLTSSPTREEDTMAVTTLDAHTALVVIDLQKGVTQLSGTPYTTDEVVARTVELADAFRANGKPVVLVRVDGAPAAPGRTDAPRWTRGEAPADAHQIVDALAGHPEDVVVTKRNWGAFYGTDLDLQLRRRGVTQIVLTGIATSFGVESTARAAHEHGYHVTLATDAMTDLSAEGHTNSVERIFPRLGETGTTAEILKRLQA